MFALASCNSFYASCEQVFRPDLRNRPVVVLANSDGCIIARSKEAEALGISDLQPFFKVEHQLRRSRVAIFASNYSLYGDLSRRVTETLLEFGAPLETSSIDEMFLDLAGYDPAQCAQAIRDTVWDQVKIPMSVGMAPTRTLAKLANQVAQKTSACAGICVLDKPSQWRWVLEQMPARTIWGVGGQLERPLLDLGIRSALDLARTDPKMLRRHGNINLERTIEELKGHSCLEIDDVSVDKRQIYSTRSFGTRARTFAPLQAAVALYAGRAAEELRRQRHLARAVHLFMHTSSHESGFHCANKVVQLPCPSDDKGVIVALARQMAVDLYRPGHASLKVGVGLLDIVDRQRQPLELLAPEQAERSASRMTPVDTSNHKPGWDMLFAGDQGAQLPAMRQQFRSPHYTTRWQDVPRVSA